MLASVEELHQDNILVFNDLAFIMSSLGLL